MQEIFDIVLRMSVQGVVIFASIFFVRLLLKKLHIAHKYIVMTWLVLFFYLVFPWKIEMPVGFWQDGILTEINVKEDAIEQLKMDDFNTQMQVDEFDLSAGVGNIHNWKADDSEENQESLIEVGLADVLQDENVGTTGTVEMFARIKEAFSYIWLITCLGLMIYFMVSFIMMKRKLAICMHDRDNIYLAQNIRTPMVFGIVKPRVYLPLHLDEANQYYVIAHEQMHIKRKDYIIKITAYLICVLHWFNPFVWLAYYLLGSDMEKACDEAVIRNVGAERTKEYANALLMAATDKLSKGNIIFAAPICFDEGDVKGRVNNIVKYKYTLPVVGVIVIIVVLALAMVFITRKGAEKENINENIVAENESTDAVETDSFIETESVGTTDGETTIRDPYYIDSENMRRVSFHDVLGYDGYFIIRKDSVPMITTYYAVEGDETFIIARSSGFDRREDYFIDLDGDGIRELVCNVCWSDGGQDVHIYRRFEDGIRVASGSSLLDVEYDYMGVGSLVAMYDVVHNRIEIACWDDEVKKYQHKYYDLDLDTISTWNRPYIPENGIYTLESTTFYVDDTLVEVAPIGKSVGAHLYGVKEIDIYINNSLSQTIALEEVMKKEGVTMLEDGFTRCPNLNEVVDLVDINSDGYKDLQVYGWNTQDTVYYFYYCWNPAENKFEYAFCLNTEKIEDEY